MVEDRQIARYIPLGTFRRRHRHLRGLQHFENHARLRPGGVAGGQRLHFDLAAEHREADAFLRAARLVRNSLDPETRAVVGAPVFHRAERLDVRQGPVQEHGLRGGEGRLGQRRGRLPGRGRLKVRERCSRAKRVGRAAEMPRMPRTLVGRVGTHVPLESAPQGVVDADLRDTRGEPGSAGFGMVSRARPEADRSRPPPFRVFESGARLIAKHASDGEDPGDRNAPASCISRRTPRPRPPLSVRICPWRSPGADRACAPPRRVC